MPGAPGMILHQYGRSPFSEKVRLALGLKGASYASVTVPAWMPKPDLLPLTGGYRRTPVLQVGADIFCDTAVILDEIERLHPAPSLYPGGTLGTATALAWSMEKATFIPAVGVFRSADTGPARPELLADREAFFGFPITRDAMLADRPAFLQRLAAHLGLLRQMLADGRPFLLGGAVSAADLAAFHPIWFLSVNGGPAIGDAVPALRPLRPWFGRVAALGHGHKREMASADALAVAAATAPAAVTEPMVLDLPGIAPGDTVGVTPDDSGRDTVVGTLVALTARRIVLRRTDPAVGAIQVHFPRAGFDITPAPVTP